MASGRSRGDRQHVREALEREVARDRLEVDRPLAEAVEPDELDALSEPAHDHGVLDAPAHDQFP